MIYLDNGHGITRRSLEFFQEHKHLLGHINSVTMEDFERDDVVYPFRIIGEINSIWLSGCAAGYGGEGPHGTAFILRDLGYPEEAIEIVFKNRRFQMGPPNDWKPKHHFLDRPRRNTEEIMDSAYEVLEFIENYFKEFGIMPAAAEIHQGCDSVSSLSMAHDRLKLLQQEGHIHIFKKKHRGIVLL